MNQRFQFHLRVYRRGQLTDFKDFSSDFVSETAIEQFVYRSTFVGSGPDLIRSISTENMMKVFTQDDPVLFLFYDEEQESHRQAF
jgi:hypothetical protein